jgi:hypothetical protein
LQTIGESADFLRMILFKMRLRFTPTAMLTGTAVEYRVAKPLALLTGTLAVLKG